MTEQKDLTGNAKLFDEAIDKWIPKLGLEWWIIKCDFCSSHRFIQIEQSDSAMIFCHANWQYLEATLRVNKDELEEESPWKIELIAVHELMHIVLNEMHKPDDESKTHEERTATILAKCFLRNEA